MKPVNKRISRRSYCKVGALVGMAGLSGCQGMLGDGQMNKAPGESTATEELQADFFQTITISSHPFHYSVPYEVAIKQGYFEEEGLQNPQKVAGSTGGSSTLRNLTGGKLAIGGVAGSASVKGRKQGIKTKIIGNLTNTVGNLAWFIDEDKDFESLSDAAGMSIGFTSKGGVSDYLPKLSVAMAEGVSVDEVEFKALGDIGANLSGLKEDVVDMGLIIPALYPLYRNQGYKIAFKGTTFADEYLQIAWTAPEAKLEENEREYQSWMNAMSKAVDYLHEAEDDQEKWDRVLTWYTNFNDLYEEKEEARLDMEVINFKNFFRVGFSEQALVNVERAMYLAGDRDSPIRWEEIIDQRFIPEDKRIDLANVPHPAFE